MHVSTSAVPMTELGSPAVRAALPRPRGPLSARVITALTGPPRPLGPVPVRTADVLSDGDLLLALHVCYELHYRGFVGVGDGWEWEPGLIAFRARLEGLLEPALRALVDVPPVAAADVPGALARLVEADDGPSVAAFVQRRATLAQVRELLAHRSVYQLKEADPHTWAIPRLTGRAKAALVEVQADEYGGGRPDRMHSVLFADAMRAVGLSDAYGGYVDLVPAITLASSVVASWFGLHRRWRGAIAGHLAALEMTSSVPMRRYGGGLRRLGLGPDATRFFDEHVEADAVHEQVAVHDLCGALAAAEPELAGDILFGAAACLALDRRVAGHVLGCWADGRSSLREPLDPVADSA
jgi:Iron-containing redox enzyme